MADHAHDLAVTAPVTSPDHEPPRPPTLRQRRKSANLDQDAAARLSGLDQTTISKLELGRVPNPRGLTLNALARAYNCSRDDIESSIRESVITGGRDPEEAPAPERGAA